MPSALFSEEVFTPLAGRLLTNSLFSSFLENVIVRNNAWPSDLKVDDTPNGRSPRKDLFSPLLCNDLINYFIVCFEHQCNTMRAV